MSVKKEYGHRLKFAWFPVRLNSYGWAWLQWVVQYKVDCYVPNVYPSSWKEYDHIREYNIKFEKRI